MSATLALAGCSTMVDLAGFPRVGVQADGSYVLTERELALDCRGLNEHVEATLASMKEHRAGVDAERQQIPKTLSGVVGRVVGGPDGGLESAKLARDDEARAHSLAAERARKGCPGGGPAAIQPHVVRSQGA